jgi:hypothetical protein
LSDTIKQFMSSMTMNMLTQLERFIGRLCIVKLFVLLASTMNNSQYGLAGLIMGCLPDVHYGGHTKAVLAGVGTHVRRLTGHLEQQ